MDTIQIPMATWKEVVQTLRDYDFWLHAAMTDFAEASERAKAALALAEQVNSNECE